MRRPRGGRLAAHRPLPLSLVRLSVTAAVLVPATALWSGRPLLFGLLGLAAVLLAADGRLDPRWLVPICWVWVNTHGSFPLALVALGALAVGRRLDEGSWGAELRVAGWTVGGILLGAVNPLGPRLLLFPLTLLAKTQAFQSIAEWQAPTYQSLVEYWVVGLLFVGVLGLVRRPELARRPPPGGLRGHGGDLGPEPGPAAARAGPDPGRGGADLGVDVGAIRRTSFRPGLVAVAGVALLVTVVSLDRPDVALDAYPEEPVAWMEDEGLWAASARVVAPDYVGNFREAAAGEEANVFLDDRVDMYPQDVLDDYEVLQDAGPGWEDVLRRREITAVLWEEDTPLGAALATSGRWEVVHRNTPWVVSVPASAP